jgi:uncharacterized protein (TIGR01619 family)
VSSDAHDKFGGVAENWDAYLATVDNKPASFWVDLGLRSEAPMPTHPWAVVVEVKLLAPNENGLTQNEEFNVLNGVEDAMLASFKSINAIYAGRMTTDGKRTSVFYACADPNKETLIDPVRAKFPEYSFDCWSDEDAEWEFYTSTLYPSDEEMQVLKNRMVLDALEADGDTLVEPRELNHWIYFEDPEKRYEFVAAVTAFGYKADCETDERWKPRPYRAMLSRVDHVAPESIDEAVLQLFRLANHYGGEYDGWETPVVRPAQAPIEKPWWKKIL